MNDVDRQITELFERNQPRTRLATYREKLEQLEAVTKLRPKRLAEIRAYVTERLDTAERIMQRESWNPDIVQDLLEESRRALINAVHEPNTLRGAKTMAAARAGHRARHGTTDDKRQHWDHLQAVVDELAATNPALSWNAIQHRAGQKAGVSAKTIQRRCKNPKQS